MKKLLAIAGLLLLAACGDATVIKPAAFSDLNGWNRDNQAESFQLFVESCSTLAKRSNAYRSKAEGAVGERENWARACDAAATLQQPTDDEARRFFETYFAPVKVETESKTTSLFTGYYEPLLHGSRIRVGAYKTPVYGMPADDEHRTLDRAAIEDGGLKGFAPVLLYVDDPVLLFFLHVQGSGKVRLTDGSLVGLQYAGQNGYPYVAIGKVLKDAGELETVSMQTIRAWLLANPTRMREVMDQNPSYVYFKLSPGDQAAKGAIGLPLTKLRSVAVDDDRAAYGVPTWIDTSISAYPTGAQTPLQRLFVSQDTGGALKGPGRGDLFFGRGELEEWQAGNQNARGDVYWLLPKPAFAEAVPMPQPEALPEDELSPFLAQVPADAAPEAQ